MKTESIKKVKQTVTSQMIEEQLKVYEERMLIHKRELAFLCFAVEHKSETRQAMFRFKLSPLKDKLETLCFSLGVGILLGVSVFFSTKLITKTVNPSILLFSLLCGVIGWYVCWMNWLAPVYVNDIPRGNGRASALLKEIEFYEKAVRITERAINELKKMEGETHGTIQSKQSLDI